jgi:hypothetical protein
VTTRATCTDCKRLWREYAKGVHAHLDALRQSLAHALREDNLALMKSEWDERTAVRTRQKARKALTEHQVTHLVQDMDTRKRQAGPAKKR